VLLVEKMQGGEFESNDLVGKLDRDAVRQFGSPAEVFRMVEYLKIREHYFRPYSVEFDGIRVEGIDSVVSVQQYSIVPVQAFVSADP
jgi:hypothetical protein